MSNFRGPLHCCANIFRRAPTSPRTARNDCSKLPTSSTTARAKPSAAAPPRKPCNDYYSSQKNPMLQRPPEFAVPLTGASHDRNAVGICSSCGARGGSRLRDASHRRRPTNKVAILPTRPDLSGPIDLPFLQRSVPVLRYTSETPTILCPLLLER